MPSGYVGRPCWKYLNEVSEALSDVKPVHNHDPFSNLSNRAVPPPSLPPRNNKPPPYATHMSKSGSFVTGIGHSGNIVVEQSEYEHILAQISQIDDTIGQELYNIVQEIEALCETDFVLPITVPKCLLIAMGVKDSLGSFRYMTDDCLMRMRNFANDIMGIG